MGKDSRPMESGIYGVIGKPGSGKSYWCAKQILGHAALDRRPVYTNIPIKLKRMRAYIVMRMQGPKPVRRVLSKLIRPTLTKQHFSRFCERLSWISERIEELKDTFEHYGDLEDEIEELEDGFWKQALIESEDEFGKFIYAGAKANWFPPGSVLFLDEVHKWFAAKGYRDEPKYVLDMTSMHRHLQLMIYVVTQRWMNASLSFRSMSIELIRCMNYARVPLLGPLRLHAWGLNLFRVGRCLPEDYDERNDELKIGKRDISFDFEFPTFNKGVYFQLYKSHVHGGSLEDQATELREVRSKLVGSNLIDQLEDKQIVTKKGISKMQWFKYGFVFAVGLLVAMALMRHKSSSENNSPGTSTKQQAVTTPAIAHEPEKTPFYEAHSLSGVVADGVYIGTKKIRIGQSFDGFKLQKVDIENGKTYWQKNNGQILDWTLGDIGRLHAPTNRMHAEPQGFGEASPASPADDQRAKNPTKHNQN